MKKIPEYIFENSHLTNWLMILVSFMGILGFLNMQQSKLPPKDCDDISIDLSWGNTAISEMENSMILSLEEKVRSTVETLPAYQDGTGKAETYTRAKTEEALL